MPPRYAEPRTDCVRSSLLPKLLVKSSQVLYSMDCLFDAITHMYFGHILFLQPLDDINTVLFKMSAAKVERTKYSKLIVTGHENGDNKCTLISQLLKAGSKPCKRERK